jgi:hypothetical protein
MEQKTTNERDRREREREKQIGAVTLGCEHQAKIERDFGFESPSHQRNAN